MTIPIARFLTEFQLLPASVRSIVLPGEPSQEDATSAPSPEELLAAQLAEAREAGHADAEMEAVAAWAEREAALQAAYADSLQAERASWVNREGQALAARFAEALEQLEHRIADATAAVLAPFLPEAVARRALDDLRTAIGTLLNDEDGPPIVVAGRADLVASIERAFSGRARLRFEPDDAPDVVVRAGETEIRSALSAWAQNLATLWDADA
jgi:hypothetical protein